MEIITQGGQAQGKELKLVLFYAMELVGFKPQNLTADGLNIIINNIERNFSRIKLDEIKTAFELGANGKLDIDLNTYQNFNTLYVSNVLNSYKRYKITQVNKTKQFTLPNPNPTGSEERERAFYWVKFNFLDESKRNGPARTFPDVIVCSWKDAYLNMIEKGMLQELTGLKLQARLKEVEALGRMEEKNPKKRLANSMASKSTGEKTKTMLFYKFEVMDYFILNSQRI